MLCTQGLSTPTSNEANSHHESSDADFFRLLWVTQTRKRGSHRDQKSGKTAIPSSSDTIPSYGDKKDEFHEKNMRSGGAESALAHLLKHHRPSLTDLPHEQVKVLPTAPMIHNTHPQG